MERMEQFRQNQRRLAVLVTNAICGMSMCDPLGEAPSDLFGQTREATTGGKDSFRRFLEERIISQFCIQSTTCVGGVLNQHSNN